MLIFSQVDVSFSLFLANILSSRCLFLPLSISLYLSLSLYLTLLNQFQVSEKNKQADKHSTRNHCQHGVKETGQ